MTEETASRPWEELLKIAKAGDSDKLEEFIESLPARETARAMAHLDADEQAKVLMILAPEGAAALIEEIPEAQAADSGHLSV